MKPPAGPIWRQFTKIGRGGNRARANREKHPMRSLYNEKRVEAAARFIADELRPPNESAPSAAAGGRGRAM